MVVSLSRLPLTLVSVVRLPVVVVAWLPRVRPPQVVVLGVEAVLLWLPSSSFLAVHGRDGGRTAT